VIYPPGDPEWDRPPAKQKNHGLWDGCDLQMQSFQSLVFDGLLKFATGDNFLLANNFPIVLNFFRDFDQQHLGMTHRSKQRNFHYT